MTLRENILFGLPFDQQLYDMVIAAAALKQDVDSLPNHDLTDIGYRRIMLADPLSSSLLTLFVTKLQRAWYQSLWRAKGAR
jgi:hypothetical protein